MMSMFSTLSSSFFFFNDTATTEIYTLSLHDALPISMTDAERTKLRRHKVGFVFQRFNLLPTLDAFGNIAIAQHIHGNGDVAESVESGQQDRKSTRLNSSHSQISYAVFCLKKKNAAFLGTINPDTNKIPKHLFQGYLNIYNNYFKAPWMPDRTEANPNELNQDDARYGFRCCHLKNIWTAPLPPETELSRQMTTSTTSIDIMGLQFFFSNLHPPQEPDFFPHRSHYV